MENSIAPSSSEGRAQRRHPSLLNSIEESREISMVVIRELGRRGARAEKPDRRNALFKQFSERGFILATRMCAGSEFQRVGL